MTLLSVVLGYARRGQAATGAPSVAALTQPTSSLCFAGQRREGIEPKITDDVAEGGAARRARWPRGRARPHRARARGSG